MVKKISVAFLGLFAVALVGGIVSLGILLHEGYPVFSILDLENLIETPSPSGIYSVYSYQVLPGAAGMDRTVVNIRSKDESFNYRTNATIFCVENLRPLVCTWKSDHDLVIHYSAGNTYNQRSHWKDVNITWVPQ